MTAHNSDRLCRRERSPDNSTPESRAEKKRFGYARTPNMDNWTELTHAPQTWATEPGAVVIGMEVMNKPSAWSARWTSVPGHRRPWESCTEYSAHRQKCSRRRSTSEVITQSVDQFTHSFNKSIYQSIRSLNHSNPFKFVLSWLCSVVCFLIELQHHPLRWITGTKAINHLSWSLSFNCCTSVTSSS